MSSISPRLTFRRRLTQRVGNCTTLVTSKGVIFVSSFGMQQETLMRSQRWRKN